MDVPIWLKWILFLVSNAVLGASIMMLWKGTFPPPMQNKKAHPVLSTAIFVISMTAFTVFGTPELLQQTIELLSKAK